MSWGRILPLYRILRSASGLTIEWHIFNHPTRLFFPYGVLETLAELNAVVEKWSNKGAWKKCVGVSFSKGTTTAFKYKQLFELQFQVGLI